MVGIRTVTAAVFLLLSAVVVIVAFASDMWLTTTAYRSSLGLWKVCRLGNCRWFYEDDFLDPVSRLPDWFIACQVMFALAVGSILLCLCFLPFYMCICSRGGSCFTCLGRTVYSMLSSAALIMGIALLVFGLEVHYSEGQERIWGQKVKALTWAFFLMVAGWCMTVISAVLFFVLHKRSQSHAI
ncbi:PREDICTED: epithelial membrane protein 1-like isoform X2 [Priapulus caudatus]|uniref:Epithelial membrane protein 1-like isoform X2 n=1 Tax=Priapulus caudatus TaxID=37621 RepID=A0ABM1ES94_PRICU|nr:PREDICTED: epithelial membrane protein 1-like isoform X2 [Priapulus caudatus]